MKSVKYFMLLIGVLHTTASAQDQEGLAGFDHGFYVRSVDGAFVFRPFGLIHTDLRVNGMGANQHR